jgi:AbiV family abortive infection protein
MFRQEEQPREGEPPAMSNKKIKSAQDTAPISADALVRGAAYALEQAWFLLADAVLFFQNGRYPSSLVLATYCLEQLGRVDIYREKSARADEGGTVTLISMRRELSDHLSKLYRAQIPVPTGMFFQGAPPVPGSDEERDLGERLRQTRLILEKHAPHKALADRTRSIHVDRIQGPPGWNRPYKGIDKGTADFYLGAAYVRYGLLRRELRLDNSEVGKRIWAMILGLGVPEGRWDVLTWEEEASESRKAASGQSQP